MSELRKSKINKSPLSNNMENENKFSGRKKKSVIIAIVVVGLMAVGASAMLLKEKKNEPDNFASNKGGGEQTDTQAREKIGETNKEAETPADIDPVKSESDDNPEIATIKKYYASLSSNKLEEAYQMRTDQATTSLDKFKGWYDGAQYLNPYEFNKTSSGSYKFYVDYKDGSGTVTKFEVEMMVIADKLKTISSVEVAGNQAAQDKGSSSDWLTYTNEAAKYTVMYPQSYAVTESSDYPGIASLNFKDTNNVNYHEGDIYIRNGNEARTAEDFLAIIEADRKETTAYTQVFEDKMVKLSNIEARKMRYTTPIGGESSSYFFTRKDGENFVIELNFEDEIRNKIIDSFKFF